MTVTSGTLTAKEVIDLVFKIPVRGGFGSKYRYIVYLDTYLKYKKII